MDVDHSKFTIIILQFEVRSTVRLVFRDRSTAYYFISCPSISYVSLGLLSQYTNFERTSNSSRDGGLFRSGRTLTSVMIPIVSSVGQSVEGVVKIRIS